MDHKKEITKLRFDGCTFHGLISYRASRNVDVVSTNSHFNGFPQSPVVIDVDKDKVTIQNCTIVANGSEENFISEWLRTHEYVFEK